MNPEDSSSGGYKITDQYAAYFLTFTIVGWIDLFTRKDCAHILLENLKYCQAHKGLLLYAYVIMGSHMHLVAACAEASSGMSAFIRDFKRQSARDILNWIKDNPEESRRDWLDVVFKYHGRYNSNNEVYQVWQQHNRPKICLTPQFTMQKINYIHFNPVKAGLVDRAEDYRYSSARNYMGRTDALLDVHVLDFGPMIGYVRT